MAKIQILVGSVNGTAWKTAQAIAHVLNHQCQPLLNLAQALRSPYADHEDMEYLANVDASLV